MVAVLFERVDNRREIIVGRRVWLVLRFARQMGLVPTQERKAGSNTVEFIRYEVVKPRDLEWLNKEHKEVLERAIKRGSWHPHWIGIAS